MTPERFIARAAGLLDYSDGRTYTLTTLARLIAVGLDLGTATPLALGAMVVLRDDLRKLCDDGMDGRFGSLRMTALHGAFDARENRERRQALLTEVDAWVSDQLPQQQPARTGSTRA